MWSESFIETLNLQQTGVHPGWPTHPFTCPARGDGQHGTEGGDLGVLIATTDGWVCPSCDYRQAPAGAWPIALQPTALIGAHGVDALGPSREQQLERVAKRIADYEALAQREASGVASMLRSLRARQDALRAPVPPLSMWVVYDNPRDYPGAFIARRFEIAHGREQPTEELLQATSLEALRALAPPGVVLIPRQEGDDPVIVECWL